MNPDLPVIPAKAGIHVLALEVGPRFRGDDRVGLAWGAGLKPDLRMVGWHPPYAGWAVVITGSSDPFSPSPS